MWKPFGANHHTRRLARAGTRVSHVNNVPEGYWGGRATLMRCTRLRITCVVLILRAGIPVNEIISGFGVDEVIHKAQKHTHQLTETRGDVCGVWAGS